MIDKSIIESICNVDKVALDQLDINKIHFDTKNPFLKYYKLETIFKAINELKIDDFKKWVSVYNLVLSGGFKDDLNVTDNEVLDLIIFEIFWILDELAFIDEKIDLNEYKQKLQILDSVINNESKWIVFYTVYEYDDEEDEWILLVNEVDNIYFELNSYFYDEDDETERLTYLTNDDYKNKKKLYLMKNYKELTY